MLCVTTRRVSTAESLLAICNHSIVELLCAISRVYEYLARTRKERQHTPGGYFS